MRLDLGWAVTAIGALFGPDRLSRNTVASICSGDKCMERATSSLPFMTRTPPVAIAPNASSCPGTPSFRTTNMSNGECNASATSKATGTPPLGNARTSKSGRPRKATSLLAKRPARLGSVLKRQRHQSTSLCIQALLSDVLRLRTSSAARLHSSCVHCPSPPRSSPKGAALPLLSLRTPARIARWDCSSADRFSSRGVASGFSAGSFHHGVRYIRPGGRLDSSTLLSRITVIARRASVTEHVYWRSGAAERLPDIPCQNAPLRLEP